MKVYHYSTSDIRGGAAFGAWRLHRSLIGIGVDSIMHVRDKFSDDDRVVSFSPKMEGFLRRQVNKLTNRNPLVPTYTYNLNKRVKPNSNILVPKSSSNSVAVIHWIDGFLDVKSIRAIVDSFNGSVCWVIHDLEPFTGGCHYSFTCQGYLTECGCCPQLRSVKKIDQSRRTWNQKKQLLSSSPLHFIATTSWGVTRLRESSLFRNHSVTVIPLPIDTEIFHLGSTSAAREILQIDQSATVLLCGAFYLDDIRKGFKELSMALRLLDKSLISDLILLVVGLNNNEAFHDLPIPVRFLGEVSDQHKMSMIYQAADMFLCPSLEESGPMMIPESMLCGTPVVAFNTGGAPDWIDHLANGYLVVNGDIPGFTQGIATMLKMSKSGLSISARTKAVALHSPGNVALQHHRLYSNLLKIDATNN